jgi:hypothetical protein
MSFSSWPLAMKFDSFYIGLPSQLAVLGHFSGSLAIC